MGRSRRKSGEVAEKILSVLSIDPNRRMSIQDISKEADITWETTRRYLELLAKLGVLRMSTEDDKQYYQKIRPMESDTLFSIPLSEEHKDIIRKVYGSIKSICAASCKDKPLSKTLVQKIAVDFVEKRYPGIPRGWYLYGELLLLPFEAEESYPNSLTDSEDIQYLRSICTEYISFSDNIYKVRRHQYEKNNKRVYLVKEDLYYNLAYSDLRTSINKNKSRQLLNEFAVSLDRKESNTTILAIIEYFCSETLAILRHGDDKLLEKAKPAIIEAFDAVWHLVATNELNESLKKFYDEVLLHDYFDERIRTLQDMALESLDGLEDYEPKFELPVNETTEKLKSLMGSARELSTEEKKKREKEIEGSDASDITRIFGLD